MIIVFYSCTKRMVEIIKNHPIIKKRTSMLYKRSHTLVSPGNAYVKRNVRPLSKRRHKKKKTINTSPINKYPLPPLSSSVSRTRRDRERYRRRKTIAIPSGPSRRTRIVAIASGRTATVSGVWNGAAARRKSVLQVNDFRSA